MSLRLSYIGIPWKEEILYGLCIVADGKKEAFDVVKMAEKYYQKKRKEVRTPVSFIRSKDGGDTFSIDFSDSIGHLTIQNVDSEICDVLLKSFRKLGEYFIVCSYQNTETTIINGDTFSMVKRDIYINGDLISRKTDNHIDWRKLLKILNI